MKNVLKLFVLFAILTATSCKKDKAPEVVKPTVYDDETPVKAFYAIADFIQIAVPNNLSNYEIGTTFKPLENGIIKAFTIKLPANPSRTRITLWNKTTGEIITTQNVPLNFEYTTDTEINVAIASPIALTKGTEYVLSMNTSNFYNRYTSTGEAANYPFTAGSIQFLNCRYLLTTNQTIPQYINYSICYGDLGFIFQRL